MAQFSKAQFLSEALKRKADPRYAAEQFFAGLRYEPFIFQQARLTFPLYNERFPAPANQAFAENFARDLANPARNHDLLKIINPEILLPEHQAANNQFETEARLEQLSIAQTNNQPPAQPFSLTATPVIVASSAAAAQATPVITMPPAATATTTTIPPEQSQPQPKIGRPPIQVPRMPPSLANAAKSFGSRAGVLFQKYVGRYATAGRIATVVSGGIGAITGGALTNGSFLGIAGGGGLGAIAPSWIRSGEGGKFLGKVGNGAINVGTNLSNQIAGGIPGSGVSVAKGRAGLVFLGALGLFFLIAIGVGLFGAMTGTTPTGEASPITSPGAILPSPGIATDCPIPNGTVTCGSQFTPINDCGHCGLNYKSDSFNAYCGFPGTKYAIDIAGNDLQAILLPKIGGNVISWTFKAEEVGATQAIQKYKGIVNVNGADETYYLQLHHTQPGSGNSGVHQSGDVGGKICGNGCNEGHVHVQVGSGGDNQNNTGWLDAAQYFCKS